MVRASLLRILPVSTPPPDCPVTPPAQIFSIIKTPHQKVSGTGIFVIFDLFLSPSSVINVCLGSENSFLWIGGSWLTDRLEVQLETKTRKYISEENRFSVMLTWF